MKPILYNITSAWPGKVEPPAVIGERFLKTLKLFEPLDPSFSDWWSTCDAGPDYENGPPVRVEALRAAVGRWVESNVCRDDWDEPDAKLGYMLGGFNRFETAGGPMHSRHLRFIVTAGDAWKGAASFEIGSPLFPADPALVTYPIFKGALLAIVSVWPAPWANAKCSIWGQRPQALPGEPPFPYSGYQMPWISYLNADRAASLPPLPALITERTADGGLLMSATTDRFDPTNVEHMRRSRQMAEIMIEHGGKPGY